MHGVFNGQVVAVAVRQAGNGHGDVVAGVLGLGGDEWRELVVIVSGCGRDFIEFKIDESTINASRTE